MSIIRSVSFSSADPRQTYPVALPNKHKFYLTPPLLQAIHGSLPTFAEVGGVHGIAHALRTHPLTGLLQDDQVFDDGASKQNRTQLPHQLLSRDDDNNGLTDGNEQDCHRQFIYGDNEYPKPKLYSYFHFCLEALTDPMLILLLVAGVLSMTLGLIESLTSGWYEGVSIISAVLLVVVIGATNDYQQQARLAKLDRTDEADLASVIRAGRLSQIHPDMILVGDVVCISAGQFVPADGIIVTDDGIKVNEAKMTGESLDISKDQMNDPFVYAGTEVREGQATVLVTAVGARSSYGRILASLSVQDEITPLQYKLAKIASLVGYVGAAVAVCLFLILLSQWIKHVVDDNEGYVGTEDLSKLLDVVIICVTIIVVAIPEGLPLAVTISLAYSMKRMYSDKIVVQKLAACETMGNATTICSDKTGTLTQNMMKVVKSYIAGVATTDAPSQSPQHQISSNMLSIKARQYVIEAVAINSKSWISDEEQVAEQQAGTEPELWLWREGNQTEISLMAWLCRLGVNINQERMKYVIEKSFPFDSIQKRSSIIIRCDHLSPISKASDRVVSPLTAKSLTTDIAHAETTSIQQKRRSSLSNVMEQRHVNIGLAKTFSWRSSFRFASRIRTNSLITGRDSETFTLPQSISSQSLNVIPIVDQNQVLQNSSDDTYQRSSPATGYRQYFKGAAEMIIQDCTRQINSEGDIIDITHCDRNQINQMILAYTRRGFRCIAFSFVDHPTLEHDDVGAHSITGTPPDRHDCVLIGFVGIEDPLRPEAYRAIRQCQRASIVVRMVTGDHIETAKAIAQAAGIFTSNYHIAMTGEQFRSIANSTQADMLQFIIPRLRVLARSKPEDKETLVRWLKAHGDIVAATGDGTNDAPALKAANAGLAMFIQGTAVAKAAASIWILDDKLTSVVKAVMWGRSTYDNIRKFIQFQLTVNVVALVLALVGSITANESPLTAVQLLWVNLIMDTFAALALGTEHPTEELLQRRPYKLDAFIISPVMARNIIVQASFQLIILFTLLYTNLLIPCSQDDYDWWRNISFHTCSILDRSVQFTFIFNTFVLMQIINELNSRKVNGELNIFHRITENMLFWFIMIGTLIVQFILVTWCGTFASTVPLTLGQWCMSVLLALFGLLVGVIQRFIPVNVDYGVGHMDPRAFEGANLHDDAYEAGRMDGELPIVGSDYRLITKPIDRLASPSDNENGSRRRIGSFFNITPTSSTSSLSSASSLSSDGSTSSYGSMELINTRR